MDHLSYDVLIVGSGAAGLRASIAAKGQGLDVCVISKGTPGKGTSTILSGGVFAATREHASPESHRVRTLQAGRGINQEELVRILVEEAPLRLKELLEWGIKGELHYGYLYAQGRPPTWGREIVDCLVTRARAMGVRFIPRLAVTELKFRDGVVGLTAYSALRGRWTALTAGALILAAGGAGALYLKHDNPQRMLGDGYALALDAGAELQDLEFVQFYPLCLAERGAPPLVIPPRLAELGRLYNHRGEEILVKYGIEERPAAERARDRLSQALFREIYGEEGEVWLDIRHVSNKAWDRDPFSGSMRDLLGERYQAKHRPVRVAPMAHHSMGGVCIDANGATSVPGLFAAGEVTGGLHGANRMGGNALSETQVFGARAGAQAAKWAKGTSIRDREQVVKDLAQPLTESQPEGKRSTLHRLKERLQRILWEKGGIVRERGGLIHALELVDAIQQEVRAAPLGDDPKSVQEKLDLQRGVRAAALILEAALRREESRGAHHREDFPHQDDKHWRGHQRVRLSPDREPVWSYHPVGSEPAP
jgi:succinate dehydrogenase/fumarate reductase flavoprotein subunit